jgi:predicted ATPase
VSGDAGIGKTSLVKHFRSLVEQETTFLWGMCDDLYTPEALALFYAIAFQLGGELHHLLPQASNLRLIGHLLLDMLWRQPKPTVIVIEDVHWADETTLDLIHFLSRRIESLPVLLLLTVREYEIAQSQSLWRLVGSVPAANTERIRLSPLSLAAIRELVASDHRLQAETVFQLTHGNPFYVTKLLASDDAVLPHSVRDAVLAREARLSANAQHGIDCA